MNRIKKKIRGLVNTMQTAAGITISHGSYSGDLVSGRNVVIQNGVVIVDGKEVGNIANVGPVTIIVEGSIEKLSTTAGSITINGDVGDCESVSGSITVTGNVEGDCETVSGSIKAGAIHGDCETVSGSIRTH